MIKNHSYSYRLAWGNAVALAETAIGLPINALYLDHRGWLHAWLRRRLGCAWTAEELTQDTFLRLLSGPLPGTVREPRAWLSTVAHGLMVNHLRRREIERAFLDALSALPEAQAPDPESCAIWLETLVEVDRVLDSLVPRVRQAFLMAQLDDLSYAQIALALGVSTSSVKQYLRTALAHCIRATL